MAEPWCPFAIIDIGNNASTYTDEGEPKGLLHTTEGKTYASAKSAYTINNSWPHMTATYERGFFQLYQHNPITLAARSLRNLPGGVETNRDRIFQIELVGTADINKKDTWGTQYVENFPVAYLDGIAKTMRWAEAQLLIPPVCTLTFKSYPSSFGNNGVRLTGPQFDSYSGWLGHQHAPENDHGDPGLINIKYLLTLPTTPPSEEEDMPYYIRNGVNGAAYRIGVGAPLHQQSITAYQSDLAVFKQINYSTTADTEAHLAAATLEWQLKSGLATDVADIEALVSQLVNVPVASTLTDPDPTPES